MGILRKILGKDTTTDVIDLLETQHKEVDLLIETLEKGEGDRRELLVELANNLSAHAAAEEKIFYPAVMTKGTSEMLRESVEEHLAIKRLLADLITMQLGEEEFMAKLAVLKEQVVHHAHKEEENELFPEVKKILSSDERAALGNEFLLMFEELMSTEPYRTVPAETAKAAQLPPTPRA